MGYVFTEVTLKNSTDVNKAICGEIKEAEIHQKTVQALVDTGAFTLVINEELRKELGLVITGKKKVILANNERVVYQRTGPVDIHWKDRSASIRAAVLPETDKILLGALPLEEMDLIVDPVREELIGRHGDEEIHYI